VKKGKKERKGMTLLRGEIEMALVSRKVPSEAKPAVIKPGKIYP
jgi:hypothetical protein